MGIFTLVKATRREFTSKISAKNTEQVGLHISKNYEHIPLSKSCSL